MTCINVPIVVPNSAQKRTNGGSGFCHAKTVTKKVGETLEYWVEGFSKILLRTTNFIARKRCKRGATEWLAKLLRIHAGFKNSIYKFIISQFTLLVFWH